MSKVNEKRVAKRSFFVILLDKFRENVYNFNIRGTIYADHHTVMNMKGKAVKNNRNVYQALMMISQFGINMLVPIFICSFCGMYLDKKLNTSFWTVFLFFIGALAGFTNVFRFAKKIYEQPPAKRKPRTKNLDRSDEFEKKD